MKKIFISPSNQTANIGLYKQYGLNECLNCEAIAELVYEALSDYECIPYIPNRADNMATRGQQANDMKADCYVSIHTNAVSNASVRGTEVHTVASDRLSMALATLIFNNVCEVSGKRRSVKNNPSLAEMKYPTMPRCLVELEFHTNAEATYSLVTDREKYAGAIAEAIVEFLGLEKKVKVSSPEEEKPTEEHHIVFKVFDDETEAQAFKLALEQIGCEDVEIQKVED